MQKHHLASASALALVAAPAAVHAQDVAAPPPSWTVQPLVVTGHKATYGAPVATVGTKTLAPLQQIPQSIQVINRTLLDEQDRRTLSDALTNVSGLAPSKPEETVLINPIVRGFQAEVYVDGLPAYGGTPVIDPSSLVNVQNVEVAKGPTSTLYGGGLGAPLGGLINLTSKEPTPRRGGWIEARGGSFSTYGGSFDLNQPLTRDGRLLARITGEYVTADSPIDHVYSHKVSVYPTVAFDISDRTRLLLRLQYSRISQLEYSGLPAALTVSGPLTAYAYHFSGASDAPPTAIENKVLTAELTHDFGAHVKGRIAARYYDSVFDEFGSFIYPTYYPPGPSTPTQYPLITGYLPTASREVTVDANLTAEAAGLGVRHQLLAGVTYDRTAYHAAIGFNFFPIGVIDYADRASDAAFGPVPPLGSRETDTYANAAVYVQDQVTIAGRLHLLGSLRFTDLELKQRELALDKHYGRVTPRIGGAFDLIEGVALFAGYSQGFRAVPNFFGATAPKPESSEGYEAGVKLAARSIGLSGTIAAYSLTRQNVTTPDPANPLLSIQTGEQRSRGVEADLIWEPVPALSVLANYAYADTAVTRDTVIPIGDALPRVPKNSGRVALRYRFLEGSLNGLSFGAGLTAVGGRQITLPNTAATPAYAIFDAQAAYAFRNYTLTLSLVNLAGAHAFDPYAYLGQAAVIPTQPRSAYVSLKVHF